MEWIHIGRVYVYIYLLLFVCELGVGCELLVLSLMLVVCCSGVKEYTAHAQTLLHTTCIQQIEQSTCHCITVNTSILYITVSPETRLHVETRLYQESTSFVN